MSFVLDLVTLDTAVGALGLGHALAVAQELEEAQILLAVAVVPVVVPLLGVRVEPQFFLADEAQPLVLGELHELAEKHCEAQQVVVTEHHELDSAKVAPLIFLQESTPDHPVEPLLVVVYAAVDHHVVIGFEVFVEVLALRGLLGL